MNWALGEGVVRMDNSKHQTHNSNGTEICFLSAEELGRLIREREVSADELVRLRDTLLDHPGRATVFLHMLGTGQDETIIELPDQVRVSATPELAAMVEQLFGPRVSFQALNS